MIGTNRQPLPGGLSKTSRNTCSAAKWAFCPESETAIYSRTRRLNSWDDFVAFINGLNDVWVKATRRLSPAVLMRSVGVCRTASVRVLRFARPLRSTAARLNGLARSLPLSGSTSRANTQSDGITSSRYAMPWESPGLKEPKYFAPVIDAFVRALPHTYKDLSADDDTLIALDHHRRFRRQVVSAQRK